MTEKKAAENAENKKSDSIKIKYIGAAQKTTVPDLGIFKHGESVTFEGEAVKVARQLVDTNKNFKEVK